MPQQHLISGTIALLDTPSRNGLTLSHLDTPLTITPPIPLCNHHHRPTPTIDAQKHIGHLDSITTITNRLDTTGYITGYPPGTQLPVTIHIRICGSDPNTENPLWTLHAVSLTTTPAWDGAVLTVHEL